MKKSAERYCMKDYGRKSTFASFLPGIAGEKGIPIWCYYVNRGQGVVSFGVSDKDHAIMEFYPAQTAYQNVKRTGFRTFIRKEGNYYEPFADETLAQTMEIEMNAFSIREENQKEGLNTEVLYYILPEESIGALVRKVIITNSSDKVCELEVLDGMPALIPYGVNMDNMKNMVQTARAWMQVEDVKEKAACYRVRASIIDTASVSVIEEGNFAAAFDEKGQRKPILVDPELVFAYDTSLEKPVEFISAGLDKILSGEQNVSNLLPCCFFAEKKILNPGESLVLYETIGLAGNKDVLKTFLGQSLCAEYFEQKYARAQQLTDQLCSCIETRTGNSNFDAYCRYTYMDNVLRGGYPIQLGNNKIFYVYSRKHGDLERDYNYFSMRPEYFSQGNGNYRDVNQNRRCDTFFAPFIGRENIYTFFNLIQLDGYNPLGIEKQTYSVEKKRAEVLLEEYGEEAAKQLLPTLTAAFTPGELYRNIAEVVEENKAEKLFYSVMDFADSLMNADFKEGYWSDHWTYNLDLMEEYLSIFPEKEKEMLYENVYTWYLPQAHVNPRNRRYEMTAGGVRQYHALEEYEEQEMDRMVRTNRQKGEILHSTLLEKLILLCTIKFASLDPYGMGVEMEGGKPGWYDALNGLPALFGSSMAATYELARLIEYTMQVLQKYPGEVELLEELVGLIKELRITNKKQKEEIQKNAFLNIFWNKINDIREEYREKIYGGIKGEKIACSTETLYEALGEFMETVQCGISKACTYADGICPTYFSYEMTSYEEQEDGIWAKDFKVKPIPLFLEGPVRYLKLKNTMEEKKRLYTCVKNSSLYDKALSMYKVNASLMEASYELGRARAFIPGWLENESIWLHMEYKYLLELLKSGMYEEFAEDFHNGAVPFLEEEVYGRSIFENSSFIASSQNPNPKIHGKGFCARLSGSTIEFINMWKIMMFGEAVFAENEGHLTAQFAPVIPEYLVGDTLCVSAEFMGRTWVTYHLKEQRSYFPGNYAVQSMELVGVDGERIRVEGAVLEETYARDLRDGKYKSVEVVLA